MTNTISEKIKFINKFNYIPILEHYSKLYIYFIYIFIILITGYYILSSFIANDNRIIVSVFSIGTVLIFPPIYHVLSSGFFKDLNKFRKNYFNLSKKRDVFIESLGGYYRGFLTYDNIIKDLKLNSTELSDRNILDELVIVTLNSDISKQYKKDKKAERRKLMSSLRRDRLNNI